MRTLCPIDFAEMAVQAGNGQESVIVLDLHNSGSDSRWRQQFPDLDDETIGLLANGSVVFLHFDRFLSAAQTFETLALQCAESGPGGLVGGTISLVATPYGEDDGVETTSWELDSDSRPVWGQGRWTYEQIADRL